MTAQSTNYFFINRKTDGLLEFTIWLSEQHIPVKQDLNEPISTAVDKAKITYLKLLKEGIKECRKYRYTRSTSKLQKLYDDMEKQSKVIIYVIKRYFQQTDEYVVIWLQWRGPSSALRPMVCSWGRQIYQLI